MIVKDFMGFFDKIAPAALKESYDNVGLMVGDEKKEVKKVLFALDATKEVIEEAIVNRVDLIITHHPLIFRKPNRIIKGDLLGDKIIKLIQNDISLYSAHTNLDTVCGGINDTIVKILGFKNSKLIDKANLLGYDDSGIGRIVKLDKSMNIKDVIILVKEKLQISNLRVALGNDNVSKIAIINGSGQDYFSKALRLGADCIITGDTTYHYVSDYKEMGVSIIDAGHFNTEYLVFLQVMQIVKDQFKDIEFIDSTVNKDPYEFF